MRGSTGGDRGPGDPIRYSRGDSSGRLTYFRSMRVLVIEDDRAIAGFIANGLRQEGFAAETAADGVEGLDRARGEAWDVIIVDVMLPRLDGLSLVEALRRAGAHTPVLFLSAKHTVDDR